MSILDEILAHKSREVAQNKALYPVKLLEKSIYFEATPVSLKRYIKRKDKTGIIAEFKRRSPSRGWINRHASVERTSIGYMQSGASALSVLTDSHYFGGNQDDLKTARQFNFCPILRKDFILDEYQVIESKAIGADAILLIAASMNAAKAKMLGDLAHSLGMEVVLELHSEAELHTYLGSYADIAGVNNRNLQNFAVQTDTSRRLAPQIPAEFIKITESGIDHPDVLTDLRHYGYDGFLIGEHFMKHGRPEKALLEFTGKLRQINTAK